MNKVDGLHHLAITTADMNSNRILHRQLGMKLVALYCMHRIEKTWHGFLRLNDESALAFACSPHIKNIPVKLRQTHTGNPGANCTEGTMQHVALRVSNHEKLMAMRDRLRAKGVPVMEPMNHGMCVCMYFAGPENLPLERSYSQEPINQQAWIDPEVVQLAGINAEELHRAKQSADFADSQGRIAQPDPIQTQGPHMKNYPAGAYEASIAVPDDIIWSAVDSQPPVKVVS
jgi:catechol 2,3-dioxygenase-like lactoylglutathione lyase family enzyme